MTDPSHGPLLRFLREHHVMCLATEGGDGPHAAPVFYALREAPLSLIFLSDPKTRHMEEIQSNPRVSLGIYLETREIGLLSGAQLWGRAREPRDPDAAASAYFKAFPHARIYLVAHPGHRFCAVSVDRARLIDNRFGFGKKLEWVFQKESG